MRRFFSYLSRALHVFLGIRDTCRFNPTCSQYFAEALETRGFFIGTFLGLRRILRCHPWGSYGNDPVPRKGI